jgi:hypothetical protein
VASCIHDRASGVHPLGRAVARVGLAGESVTFRDSTPALYACDGSSGGREPGRWCDGAFARLRDGALQDPRLSIGCATEEGDEVAFVWVQPLRSARYVAVAQGGFTEVYETAGKLPVRIATTAGVDVSSAAASFEVTEHDRAGRLLRRTRIDARVAG